MARANFKPAPLPALHITSDGDISNSSALIRRTGDIYTLTGNWSSTSYFLEVDRSNIVIDGAGFFIMGNGYALGIDLKGVSNVKIANVNIADRNRGIYLENCSNVTLTDCSVTGGNHGVYLNNSNNNAILNNRLLSNFNGIYLDHSGGNVLRNNNIQTTTISEPIQEKPEDLLPGQLDFGLNFMVTGDAHADYLNDVDASNLVNGKPIFYWVGRQNAEVPPDAAYVGLIDCRAIIVQNQRIYKTQGILVAWTTNSTVTNNLLCRDINGIQVLHSTDIKISANQIWENTGLEEGGNGINLAYSQSVTVANNQIMANWNGGITCTNSSRNQLIGNIISRNWHNGINLVGSSDYNLVALNHLFNHSTNSRGAVAIENSRNNYLIANNFTDNGCWAIQLTGEQGNNTFYRNNFMNNSYRNIRRTPGALQISTPGTTNGNSWDNSSYGNYWSDYGGKDANGDGIGDSPYYINPTNQDNYPLVNPAATSKVPLEASQLPSTMFSSPESPAQQLIVAAAISALVAVAAVVYLKERKPSSASVVKNP